MLLGRIAPRDHEGLLLHRQQELDHRRHRRQIHRIEFVDLRRNDQDRRFVNFLRRRSILDQLQHLVFPDDRAFRHREILAHLEGALVDLRRQTAILGQIVIEVLHPLQQREAARIDHALRSRRVADQRIGRRHRIGNHAHHELGARMLQLAHLHFADPLVQVLLRREEGLHAALVERVVLPSRVLEPAVLLVGFAFRFAEQDFGILGHDLARRLGGRHRIGHR